MDTLRVLVRRPLVQRMYLQRFKRLIALVVGIVLLVLEIRLVEALQVESIEKLALQLLLEACLG